MRIVRHHQALEGFTKGLEDHCDVMAELKAEIQLRPKLADDPQCLRYFQWCFLVCASTGLDKWDGGTVGALLWAQMLAKVVCEIPGYPRSGLYLVARICLICTQFLNFACVVFAFCCSCEHEYKVHQIYCCWVQVCVVFSTLEKHDSPNHFNFQSDLACNDNWTQSVCIVDSCTT